MHRAHISFENDNQNITDKIQFIFAEIKKINQTEQQLKTPQDKWLYLLKKMKHLQEVPKKLNIPPYRQVFKRAGFAALSEQEKLKYAQDIEGAEYVDSMLASSYETGIEKQNQAFVKNMVQNTNHSMEEIPKTGRCICSIREEDEGRYSE